MKDKMGVRSIIIAGMNREQLINLIKRREKTSISVNFDLYSDKEILELALKADRKMIQRRNGLMCILV